MISKNFFESLQLIVEERKLDIEDILKKVEIALGVACRHVNPPYTGDIKLEVNFEQKKIRAFEYKYVVDQIDPNGPRGQILLEEAQKIKDRAKVGQIIKTEIDFSIFKRKPAQYFKQIFNNGLKELERERAYQYFKERVGDIITAKVVSVNDGFITFNIGLGYESHMPIKEGLEGEEYNIGDEKKVYITKVEKTGKGPKVFISRANKEIVKRLFEITIPEISNGDIEIMGIARDPGSRTKIGVMSLNPNIDAKGACVGAGGLRIKSINAALNDEKIDVFTWKEDPVELIAEALLPARVLSVMLDQKEKKATVIVDDDQYSLAIGRNGQNARLAAYVTNWKIDIKKLSDAQEEGIEFEYNVTG